MTTAMTTATETAQFALIRHEARGANAEIVAVGSEAAVLAAHAETPSGGGIFHSVRPVGHELTTMAVQQMAARLTANQRAALADLESDRRRYGRKSVRPGYEARGPHRWLGMSSSYLNAFTKSAKLAKLVRVSGVAYGPKTYTLTSLGRIVAAEILAQQS